MADLAIQELSAMSECAVCLSSPTSPKVLPCQHIFCLACLQGVYDQATKRNPTTMGQLTCPMCSTVSPILAGDLTQLHSDFRTNQVTTLIETLRKATSAWNCTVCYKNKLNTDTPVLCFDCGKLFCANCHKTHIANKRFNDHVYTSVISDRLDELYCGEHKEFFYKFCIDCNIGVCQMCFLTSHEDHRVEDYAQSDGIPGEAAAEIAHVEMEVNQLLDQHKSICQREVIHTQTLKDNIRKQKLDLIKKLDDGEHELFIKVDDELKQFQGLVEKTVSSLKGTLPKLAQFARESQIITRPLSTAPNIKLRVTDLPLRRPVKEIKRTPYKLHSPSNYKFVKSETSLGSLHQVSPISATHYSLDGSNATVRETASVVTSYQAKKRDELNIQEGDIIEIRMKSNDGWWVGEMKSPGQTTRTGWFPADCVTVMSSVQPLKTYTKENNRPLEVDPFSIIVTHIDTDITKDALELFFESERKTGGGNIRELDYERGSGTATITFEDDQVVRNILAEYIEQGLVHGGCTLSVHPRILNLRSNTQDKYPVDPRVVIVENVSSTTTEGTLMMFLESKKKSGGGDILQVEYNPDKGLAKVIFEDENAAVRVLKRGDLQLDGSSLKVTRPQPQLKLSAMRPPTLSTKSQCVIHVEEPERFLHTVIIEVIKGSTTTDLKKYLEASPEFRSDKIAELDIYSDRNMAVVRFKDHKDAQNVVERGLLSVHDLKLRVSPVDTSVEDSGRYQGPLAIAVTNIESDTTVEMIKIFFRNRSKSGGGEITALYWDPQKGKSVITFTVAQAVANIIEKHRLKTLRMARCGLHITRMIPLPPPKLILGPKEPRRAVIIEAPEVTPDELKQYIGSVEFADDRKGQKPELVKVLYSFEGRTIMLEFCKDPDFVELGLLFATRPLADHMMTLQRVALPTQIQVRIIQPSDHTEDMLELYFQDPSHGGDESVTVEYVDEKQKYAILQCSSPAVVDSVTRRSHTVFGHDVHVAVYYPEFGVIPPNYDASKPWKFYTAPYRHKGGRCERPLGRGWEHS